MDIDLRFKFKKKFIMQDPINRSLEKLRIVINLIVNSIVRVVVL